VEVSAGNELFVPLDDIVRGWLGFAWRQNTARPADIVNPHHQNHGIGMRTTQDVAIESRQRIHPHTISQNSCARDSLIEYRSWSTAGLS
jgi:hypothetical protein